MRALRVSQIYPVALAVLTGILLSAPIDGIARSSSAKHEFRKLHPCPTNPAPRGPCRGYVIDHVIPLVCGGADAPGNMQWQTIEAGKAKDRWETKGCRGSS